MLWFAKLLRTCSGAFTYVNVPLSLEVFWDASAPVHSSVVCISLYFAVIVHACASVQSAVFSCQGVRKSFMLDAVRHSPSSIVSGMSPLPSLVSTVYASHGTSLTVSRSWLPIGEAPGCLRHSTFN